MQNGNKNQKEREQTMGEFWTRAISLVAVIVCLTGYNTVLDKREQAEENSKSSRQSWNRNSPAMRQRKPQRSLIKTEPIPEKHRDLADRWMWKLSLKTEKFLRLT